MDATEVLARFADPVDGLPTQAMQWALDHWEEVWPAFLERLEAPSDVLYVDEARFLIVHLVGDRGEPQAHAPSPRPGSS